MGRTNKDYKDIRLADQVEVIAKNLRSYRETAELSQTKLAKVSGVGLSTINEIENSIAKDIRFSTLSSLSKALDIEIYRLILPPDLNPTPSQKRDIEAASRLLLGLVKSLKIRD